MRRRSYVGFVSFHYLHHFILAVIHFTSLSNLFLYFFKILRIFNLNVELFKHLHQIYTHLIFYYFLIHFVEFFFFITAEVLELMSYNFLAIDLLRLWTLSITFMIIFSLLLEFISEHRVIVVKHWIFNRLNQFFIFFFKVF